MGGLFLFLLCPSPHGIITNYRSSELFIAFFLFPQVHDFQLSLAPCVTGENVVDDTVLSRIHQSDLKEHDRISKTRTNVEEPLTNSSSSASKSSSSVDVTKGMIFSFRTFFDSLPWGRVIRIRICARWMGNSCFSCSCLMTSSAYNKVCIKNKCLSLFLFLLLTCLRFGASFGIDAQVEILHGLFNHGDGVGPFCLRVHTVVRDGIGNILPHGFQLVRSFLVCYL